MPKGSSNGLSKASKITGTIFSILMIILILSGAAWAFIDWRIEKKQEPLTEAIEFQTLIMLQAIPDTTYTRILRMWKSSKNIIPKKEKRD